MTVRDKAAYTSLANREDREDREDDVEEARRAEEVDEEAQLLNNEDYEQFELVSPGAAAAGRHGHPPSSAPAHHRQSPSSSHSLFSRRRAPRWLAWLYGPDPPRIQSLRPCLPAAQELPVRALHTVLPRSWHRAVLFVLFLAAWTVAIVGPGLASKCPATTKVGGVEVQVRQLACDESLWRPGNECGLDGAECRPFANATFAFRCPRGCNAMRVTHRNHFVGKVDVEEGVPPPVVGGGSGSPFRGDSSICRAAIHAGVIDDEAGRFGSACGVVKLVGEYYQFFGSSSNGVDSMGFGSRFPLSFTVEKVDSGLRCVDVRWMSIPATVFLSMLLALFTTSATVFFFTVFVGLFAQVALLDDPFPGAPLDPYLERLIPALVVVFLIYRTCVRRTLASPASASGADARPATTNLTKLMLWLFPAWLGALSIEVAPYFLANDSPAYRVPAPIIAGLSVLVFIVIIVLQTRTFYLESRLPAYLTLYAGFLVVLAILASFHLRPAHHALSALLLPASAARTAPSMVLQGLLTGVFVHGAASRGFGTGKVLVPITWSGAKVMGTPEHDSHGEDSYGEGSYGEEKTATGSKIPLPDLVPPLIERLSNGTWTEDPATYLEGGLRLWLGWRALEDPNIEVEVDVPSGEHVHHGGRRKEKIAGISVLVNDVERFRGWFSDQPLEEQVFRYKRGPPGEEVHLDEYFRFGFVTESGKALGYTEAGTWFANGSFSQGEGYW
ncbi:hypothetical protein VTJ04DRAFT_7178 [Mycothermus thermophilus]|uniref:uncharacterized protein n=1 Tax=Humicola insolens TaxID=85995 RepID=UPI003744ACFA